ncbi:hypothetical protein BLOT_004577, partial [Blomia tropicalis]
MIGPYKYLLKNRSNDTSFVTGQSMLSGNIYKVFQLGEIIGYDLKSIGNIGQLCLIVQPTDVIGGHVRSLHINNLLSFNLGKELMFLT